MSLHVDADFSYAFAPTISGGVDSDVFQKALSRCETFLAEQDSRTPSWGFWALPDGDVAATLAMADALRKKFDTLVVLGIGGSSLGGIALKDALAPDAPVHFWDNIDPITFNREFASLDLDKTCFNVVSKSGGTVETASLFCLVRERLVKALGQEEADARFIFTTDPAAGSLRKLADERGVPTLPIPPSVGGRFSVLTDVGLFPAAFMGLDPDKFLQGAKAMRTACAAAPVDGAHNIASTLASGLFAADRQGISTHNLMPYVDGLRSFADWFVQLWAESLGKKEDRSGKVVHVGPLPHAAKGATDQHSQVQLFMEGPNDKVTIFIGCGTSEGGDPDMDIAFPKDLPDMYRYLEGHSLGGLLQAERIGTTQALAQAGRPSITLSIPLLDEAVVGALFFLFEATTGLAGELYGIDAFDQPGVEAGKRIAFAKLGRPGYEADRFNDSAIDNTSLVRRATLS